MIGTIFRFREGPIALTADIEPIFLQVPERDKSCLRFLWRPTMNQPVQTYEYQRHVSQIHSYIFWSGYTTLLQWIHSSHRKQQVFVANRIAEILDTTNVSQWNHVSGINNPADIGTRAINVDELNRSERLTGPAWFKQPESQWPVQVTLTFASDDQNDQMVLSEEIEEKKPMIQWERFNNFNPLKNTMAYVQRVLKKTNRPQKHKLLKIERVHKQASSDYCSKNSSLKR